MASYDVQMQLRTGVYIGHLIIPHNFEINFARVTVIGRQPKLH